MSAKNSNAPSAVKQDKKTAKEDKSEVNKNSDSENEDKKSKAEEDDKKEDSKIEEKADVKNGSPKKKLKVKSKAQIERDSTLDELQRDVLVRDDTIKELNIKIVYLEGELRKAVEIADDSKQAKQNYKLSNMENDLRHAKTQLVLNTERIEKFMEDGSKTIDEYRARWEMANTEILELKKEILTKESLLKNKDDVYKRVLDDLQLARKTIGDLQLEKLQTDHKNNQLQADLDRVKEEKLHLEDRIIDLESMKEKIIKQNKLVNELDTQFYGLSVDELGNEINKSMFELCLKLRTDYLKHIIDGSLDLKDMLKEDGLLDLAAQLDEIKNLKEESDDEFDHTKKTKLPAKKVEKIAKNVKPIETKPEELKTKRTGGGFKLDTDDKLEKEDKKKADLKKKDEKVTKLKVENAKKNNKKVKMLMNASKIFKKDKDGNWQSKPSFYVFFSNIKDLKKDSKSIIGNVLKWFSPKSEPTTMKGFDAKFEKENIKLKEKIETYARALTSTTSQIINFVLTTKFGIDEIEENYKGFFSMKDKAMIESVKKSVDKTKQKEVDPLVKIKDLKREIDDFKTQLKQLAISHSELEIEAEKLKKKEQILKSKLTKVEVEAEESNHANEMRISEYKSVVRSKDEEITSLKEHNRSQEKLVREYSVKTTANGYELEQTLKKLAESKHHQDLLTKRLREYEDVVRVINKNLKQNTNENTVVNKSSKTKEKEIENTKVRNKVLEDELHKREDLILNYKSILKKLQQDIVKKDEEIHKIKEQGTFDTANLEGDKQIREFNSQIEVLKEMIVGLKAQLKAKDMDGYRQDAKLMSLQSTIETLRARERQLENMMGTDHNSLKYSPAVVNKGIKLKTQKQRDDDSVYSRGSKRQESRGTPQPSKPLIKSGIKVQKGKEAIEKDNVLDKIMSSQPKKEKSIVESKPNFSIKNRDIESDQKIDMNKSIFSDKSDLHKTDKLAKQIKYSDDEDEAEAEENEGEDESERDDEQRSRKGINIQREPSEQESDA